ncbi:MAG TPA: FKBP-type peptidyl-prolyl cis-trans isomerase [Jatrophihabitans sp.]|jgi:peptidylprolyl isomerase|nr:FKBP-type peptidyl-prolyl cis-trans isomerase [Jatrophihabitans sp.]
MTGTRTAAVALGAGLLLAGCSSGSSPADAPSILASSTSSSAPAEVSFAGVTLTGAADLTAKPKVIARSATAPAALSVKDVVTGSGAAATPTSTVTVQYVGVRYADGKQFVASWDHGGATSFSLRGVVPGLTRGIGGAPGTEPMKVGGRRIVIVPAALGYGRAGTPDRSIPPNAPIVFVVDLVAVK